MKTDQSGQRGWCFAPYAEPKTPVAVKVVMAVIVLAGIGLMAAPSIARMIVA